MLTLSLLCSMNMKNGWEESEVRTHLPCASCSAALRSVHVCSRRLS